MADRTTKSFTTPGGHEVVMYDYITGGEMQEIARKAPKDASDRVGQIEAGNQAIVIAVRSLGGSSEDLLQRILDLPLADYQAISEEVSGLIREKKS